MGKKEDLENLRKLDKDFSEAINVLKKRKDNSKKGSKAQEAYLYSINEVKCLHDKLRSIIFTNEKK